MTAPWSLKHRPLRFEDVVGQDPAVQALRRLIRRPQPTSILLAGPSGVGKTTLARIYAQGLVCRAPQDDGSPCGLCAGCRQAFSQPPPGVEVVGPASHDTQSMRALVAGEGPFGASSWQSPSVRVVVLEDADQLRGWRFLKAELDAARPDRAWIITVDSLGHVPAAIRDRLVCLELAAPRLRDLCRALVRVADAEGLKVEPATMSLIAADASSVRAAIQQLEDFAQFDAQLDAQPGALVTAAMVRQSQAARRVWLIDYVEALGRQDLRAQFAALGSSGLSPSETVAQILSIIVWLRLGEEPQPETDASTKLTTEDLRRRALQSFAAAASALGTTTPVLWDVMARYWSAAPHLASRSALEARAVLFVDEIKGQVAGDLTVGALVGDAQPIDEAVIGKPRRLGASPKVETGDPDAQRSEWLSAAQARAICDAASLALQLYWAPFNTQIEICWSDGARHQPGGIGRKVDRFAQALQRQVGRWGCQEAGGGFCRIILHQQGPSGAMKSILIGHVPPRHRDDLQRWIGRQRVAGVVQAVILPAKGLTLDKQVQTHWDLVRKFWAGVDPAIRVGNRYPLLDLLKVSAQDRGPIGPGFVQRRYSTSQAIGESVQHGLAAQGVLISAFGDGAWSWIDRGWERPRFLAAQRRAVEGLAEINNSKLHSDAKVAAPPRTKSSKNDKKQILMPISEPAPWDVRRLDSDEFEAEIAAVSPLFPELNH